jgi:ribosome maturation factor RimP
MIDSQKVKELVTQAITKEEAFLIDLNISSDDRIKVLVDHLDGISIDQLIRISRFVERSLDEDGDEFQIEVSSPGVGSPFTVKEQYIKSVGRPVKVILNNGLELNGDFTKFENDTVTVSWSEKQPKPVGKGKIKVQKEENVSLEEIKEISLELRF